MQIRSSQKILIKSPKYNCVVFRLSSRTRQSVRVYNKIRFYWQLLLMFFFYHLFLEFTPSSPNWFDKIFTKRYENKFRTHTINKILFKPRSFFEIRIYFNSMYTFKKQKAEHWIDAFIKGKPRKEYLLVVWTIGGGRGVMGTTQHKQLFHRYCKKKVPSGHNHDWS